MQVVIIHYHLFPGGVSRIIEAQINGIQIVSGDTEIKVLCGNANRVPAHIGTTTEFDSSLNYINADLAMARYVMAVSDIVSFISKSLTEHTILHFHNPNLGKNPALTMAAYKLASEGFPVINHCHDFPEDRPANLAWLKRIIPGLSPLPLQQVIYPDFPWYHFIVLNSCDYNRLLQQGISASRIHFLPNPVSMNITGFAADKQSQKRKICRVLDFDGRRKICTYPVRAIERKNLGEFILFAALFADAAYFVVTQPPKNPAELPRYNQWKVFCRENGLTVKFEAGELVNHEELINISDFCITTSTQEGFGMVYLEPWLAGTPVIGRELSCIIGDMKNQGIEFPRLYKSILVEMANDMVDFKDIRQDQQENIITAVIRQHELRAKLFKNNPFLSSLLDDFPPEIIARNQQLIKRSYSIEEYGKGLLAIYKEISR